MVKKLSDKFFGSRPLEKIGSNSYPDILDLHYNKFELPKEIRLVDVNMCQKIEKKVTMVFGVAGKEEKLIKYDFLDCRDGLAEVVHKRVLEKLEQMCPDDFEVIPVVIKNLSPKAETFINKDFVLINILHSVDSMDKEKTIIKDRGDNHKSYSNIHFKENCMEGHLLARDSLQRSTVLFDPKLAREFVKSKGVAFLEKGI